MSYQVVVLKNGTTLYLVVTLSLHYIQGRLREKGLSCHAEQSEAS